MSNYRIIRSDELYHHGIKGMKWGVRRFQNEDGTLTEAGRKRYEKAIDRASRSSIFGITKVHERLGKVGADILKNNENSVDVKSIRAKYKRSKDLEAEWRNKREEVANSKAGKKEIADTIKYYAKKYGERMGVNDARSDLIGNPNNPYHKTSIIAKTYNKYQSALNKAYKEYDNAVSSYISKLTGSDEEYVSAGYTAVQKAIADEWFGAKGRK